MMISLRRVRKDKIGQFMHVQHKRQGSGTCCQVCHEERGYECYEYFYFRDGCAMIPRRVG